MPRSPRDPGVAPTHPLLALFAAGSLACGSGQTLVGTYDPTGASSTGGTFSAGTTSNGGPGASSSSGSGTTSGTTSGETAAATTGGSTTSGSCAATAWLTPYATNGSGGFKDGTLSTAQFGDWLALAFDASGNMFVADGNNHAIRKIDPSGNVTTVAGQGPMNPGFVNGQALAAQFNEPDGIAFDSHGNMFISDSGNNVIREMTPSGLVSTFAGDGMPGLVDGPAQSAEFFEPAFLAIDGQDNVYVSDTQNRAVRKITSGGVVSTVASTTDTPAFDQPVGIAINSLGVIYASAFDISNPDGAVDAVWSIEPGSAIAAPIQTPFSANPAGLLLDGNGNTYMAVNEVLLTVYKLTSAGTWWTLPASGCFLGTDGLAIGPSGSLFASTFFGGGAGVPIVEIDPSTAPWQQVE